MMGNPMRIIGFLLCLIASPVLAQEPTIAIIGMVHSHVWGQIDRMIRGDPAKLVGIAETAPDLIDEAKKRGATGPFFDDYKKMLDEVKPTIVSAFVENN